MRMWVACGLVMTVLGVGVVRGQEVVGTAPAPAGKPVVLLWPAGAPGALGDADEDKPTLTVFLPAGVNATETGVVVAPGGGYQHLATEKEGFAIAEWLNARGVAAFVLKYRLGPKYHYPAQLSDAQRAIQLVRAHAAEYGIAPDHVGMWGFSAGGHLTATVGTRGYPCCGPVSGGDAIDKQRVRPDFLVLAYPVITMMEPYVHGGSLKNLLGDDPDPALARSLSAETRVTTDTPPTFLFSTTDDKTVPVMNSVMFYEALVKAGVPAEMHIFQQGAHGAGLAAANPQLSVWPDLVAKWMRERGYMSAAWQ